MGKEEVMMKWQEKNAHDRGNQGPKERDDLLLLPMLLLLLLLLLALLLLLMLSCCGDGGSGIRSQNE